MNKETTTEEQKTTTSVIITADHHAFEEAIASVMAVVSNTTPTISPESLLPEIVMFTAVRCLEDNDDFYSTQEKINYLEASTSTACPAGNPNSAVQKAEACDSIGAIARTSRR